MINYIWYIMIIFGVLVMVLSGDSSMVVKVLSQSAKHSTELLIGLAGVMAIWTGLVRVAEEAGFTRIISIAFTLPMKLLFPGLKEKNPEAFRNIVMNITSNVLGLSNAATPFGIKAVEELQKINSKKDRASDYMVTFLIVNSACIQLLPATVISIRAEMGSVSPSDIIIPTMLSTLCALAAGLAAKGILNRFFRRGR